MCLLMINTLGCTKSHEWIYFAVSMVSFDRGMVKIYVLNNRKQSGYMCNRGNHCLTAESSYRCTKW